MKTIRLLLFLMPLVLLLILYGGIIISGEGEDVQAPAKIIAVGHEETSDTAMQITEATQTNQSGAVIAFTFDDGYLSDYELAYPILKKYNIRGTSYIIPEYQDQSKEFALSWDQVREMRRYGWTFGCHTYTHTDLKKMTADDIAKSIEMVNESFEKQGLEPPVVHAFPFGSYNQQAIDAMKPYRAQMRKAYYEESFVDISNVNPYEIDSCSVEWPVQTDSRLFEELVAYCVQKGCRFITMTELIDRYTATTS